MSNFPWLSILKDKNFNYDGDYIWGNVKFLGFDQIGNPVYTYNQQAICMFLRHNYYIRFDTDMKKWILSSYIYNHFPIKNPSKPLDVIGINYIKDELYTVVSLGLESIVKMIKDVCQFVERGKEKKYTQFLNNLILCNRYSKYLPSLPLELLFLITTFMRKAEVDNIKNYYQRIDG
jgi:hypothetical protein